MHLVWNRRHVDLIDLLEHAVARAEAHDDLGHAEQEGLDPVLEQLTLEVDPVPIVADGEAGLELDPVDGVALFFGLVVPDCGSGEGIVNG